MLAAPHAHAAPRLRDVWAIHANTPDRTRIVNFLAPYTPGTIVIDENNQYLYLMGSGQTAIRYPVVVGSGQNVMRNTQWRVVEIDMQPHDANTRPGPENLYGVAAIDLMPSMPEIERLRPNRIRAIHGTNRPDILAQPDGTRRASLGCVRMHNVDILDLVNRRLNGQVTVYFRQDMPRFEHYFTRNTRGTTLQR